ncbi:hypothetical protein A3860_33705 [Niastella vici]|uniref:Uncharacterized protein n=1 Tax=Niastella vici TaxID=1703345 RepID=A0A1V9FPW2_9BACT|nr:hypothetical protein [Niastella vici]OQP60337.1 hypothetical protein A3860_33705 [Niastella vici]
MSNSKKDKVKNTQSPKLTLEEISSEEWVSALSPEQKEELIDFVYELSLFLYNSYSEEDEKQP